VVLTSSSVISIDATIVIGLLILLTFQSISSAFIESESQKFSSQLFDSDKLLSKYDNLISLCDAAVTDPVSFEQEIKDLVLYDIPPDDDFYIQEKERELDPELFSEFKTKCKEWEIQRIDVITTRIALEEWGFSYGYLDEFMEESDYLRSLATGPFYIKIANLVMVFPFLVSAVIESIVAQKRKDETTTRASKGGVWFMMGGFLVIMLGLTLIAFEFYHVSSPFL